MNDMLMQAIDNMAANIVFGIIVLLALALAILMGLLLLAGIRGLWHWMTSHSWNDVIRSIQRKALLGKANEGNR